MKKFFLLLLLAAVIALNDETKAQTMTLSLPDTTLAPGSTIDVPIVCTGFTEIVSMQFSLSWDVSVVTFQSTTPGALENVAVGGTQAGSGILRVSWFDVEGKGKSLADGTVVAYLRFTAVGPEDSTTPVNFTNSPLLIQVYRSGNSPGVFDEVPFEPVAGQITVATPQGISVAENIEGISCAGAADGRIGLTITYDNEYRISWSGPDFSSTEAEITDLRPGVYDLRIEATDGTVLYENTITLTEPEPLIIAAIEVDATDCELQNGRAEITAAGGTLPYRYDWGGGPTDTSQREDLTPGTYTLTLTDANNCSTIAAFSIESPELPQPELGPTVPLCPGSNTMLNPGTFTSYAWSTGATTAGIEVTEPGTYAVTVTNAAGCQAEDAVLVETSSELPEVDLGPSIQLCPGESATLNGGTFDSYAWSTGATTASIEISEAGTYSLTVTNAAGCSGSGSISVEQVGALPELELGEVQAICPGETLTLSAAGTFASYKWSTGATSASIEVSQPGTYSLTVTNAGGCQASDMIEVVSGGEPIDVDLGPPITICPGETTTLSAGAFNDYLWSTGATSASIQVGEAGIYEVTITNNAGCTTVDAVEVMIEAPTQLVIENDFLDLCPQDSIELMISGADTYTWIDTSNSLSALNIANPFAHPDTTTGYTVIGSKQCSSDTVELEVFVYETSAMAGPDTCVTPGSQAQLMAFGGISYRWEDAPYPVSDPTSPMPTVTPEDSTHYVVYITDFQGCVIRDTVLVAVAENPEEAITAVNMITPNGDGKNDVLYFKNMAKFGQNSLKVFNRWGNIVYSKVNYQSDEERFDGTYNGKELPPGTYYYQLTFRTGEIKQKLTILR